MPSSSPAGPKGRHTTSTSRTRASPLSFGQCALWLLPIYTLLLYLGSRWHYKLPTPVDSLTDASGNPHVSERAILSHIRALEDIGYRIVGTDEAVRGEEYVLAEVQALKARCDSDGVLQCEVWDQVGNGVHQFDIMDHAVLKSYQGIRNVILRIAPKGYVQREGVKDAVLLNAHIDSALPSKGSADDAIGVAVMLDIARVLVDRKKEVFAPAVFLFNGAEETLQDASHMYSTQHETRHSIRAALNLEAAGTTGGALLFQATSAEMVEAYAHAPHPHGTVIAADIFASGIIMSDTDFVQFEKYLGVSGMDMATVGHSYYYHTRKDLLENIEAGSAQHFAENTMGILDYLLAPDNILVSPAEWSPPDLAYAGLFDAVWIRFKMEHANRVYTALVAALLLLLAIRAKKGRMHVYALAYGTAFASLLAGLVASVLVALLMAFLLGKGQSWFSHEHFPMLLFGPPAMLGSLACQYFLSSCLSVENRRILEHASFFGQLGVPMIFMAVMQFFQIRSGYLFAALSLSGLLALTASELIGIVAGRPKASVDFFAGHLPLALLCMGLGVEAVTNILDIFVPLTGRMGREAPTEIIIAVIASTLTFLFVPTTIPFFHRFGRRTQRRMLLSLGLLSAVMIVVFASRNAYDAQHPKRIGVQHVHNVTSGDNHLHIAQMDSGPGFTDLLNRMHERYGHPHRPLTPNPREGDNSDWDILYPISAFLETEMFELGVSEGNPGRVLPEVQVEVVADKWDASAGGRKVTLAIEHAGLVYPVVAFSAEVASWSFDAPPPTGHQRHYIKAAASPGHERFEVSIDLRMLKGEKLDLHWVGIDKHQLFPSTATSTSTARKLASSRMFVDMDAWMVDEWKGALDVLMIGVVAGAVSV